jgi:hypothetical protein
MAKQNSVNLPVTTNADGFDITGGTVARKLSVTGADIAIVGTGAQTYTFPATSCTLAAAGASGATTIFVAASNATAAEKTLATPTYTCDGVTHP